MEKCEEQNEGEREHEKGEIADRCRSLDERPACYSKGSSFPPVRTGA